MQSSSKALDQLEGYYKAFVNRPERHFFLGLSDYVKYIKETPELIKIVETQVLPDRKALENNIDNIRHKTIKQCDVVIKQIEDFIARKEIEDARLLETIKEYHELREAKLISSDPAAEYITVCEALRQLVHNRFYEKELGKLIKVVHATHYDLIEEFLFSPAGKELIKSLDDFSSKRNRTTWGSWFALELAEASVDETDNRLQLITDIGPYVNSFSRSLIFSEMRNIVDPKHAPPPLMLGEKIQFVIEEYKTHVNRLHLFLKSNISDVESIKNNDVETRNYVVRDGVGLFYFNGKKVLISRESLQYQCFNILFENADQSGFVSYKTFENELQKIGRPHNAESKTSKRVRNALTNKHNGFFFRARYENGERVKNEDGNGKRIVETIRGKGIRINNPLLM